MSISDTTTMTYKFVSLSDRDQRMQFRFSQPAFASSGVWVLDSVTVTNVYPAPATGITFCSDKEILMDDFSGSSYSADLLRIVNGGYITGTYCGALDDSRSLLFGGTTGPRYLGRKNMCSFGVGKWKNKNYNFPKKRKFLFHVLWSILLHISCRSVSKSARKLHPRLAPVSTATIFPSRSRNVCIVHALIWV